LSERDGYEHGVPCWVETWQPDAEAAVAFYTELFGWEAEEARPDADRRFFMCRLRGHDVAAIGSPPPFPDLTPVWGTYIWVDDPDETVAKAIEAGGTALKEPFESLDGGRMAILADPAGAVFGVWQPGSHRGAQVVNEAGAWSMSPLHTRDPEAAAAFYRAVFGWEPEEMEGVGASLMRLSGFVGGEPLQPVPRDVVSVMAPMNPDQFSDDVPPHWSIDFWVKDADATAKRAAELGGAVIVEPFDVPGIGMRQAVLADPQGATFSITRAPGPPD
jgi:uncharacterized protein